MLPEIRVSRRTRGAREITFPATGTVYGLGSHVKLAPRDNLYNDGHAPTRKKRHFIASGRRSMARRREEQQAYARVPLIGVDTIGSSTYIQRSPRREHDINFDPTKMSLNGYSSRTAALYAEGCRADRARQKPVDFASTFKTTGTVTSKYTQRRPPRPLKHQEAPKFDHIKSQYEEFRLCPTPDFLKLDSDFFDDVRNSQSDLSQRGAQKPKKKRVVTPFKRRSAASESSVSSASTTVVKQDGDESCSQAEQHQHSAASIAASDDDASASDYEQLYVYRSDGDSGQPMSASSKSMRTGSAGSSNGEIVHLPDLPDVT